MPSRPPTAECAALRRPVISRSFLVAVPVEFTKCRRRPGTRRAIRYWTQSASPTQTGEDVERFGPRRPSVPTGVHGVQESPSLRARSAIAGSVSLRQEKPTRLKRLGV